MARTRLTCDVNATCPPPAVESRVVVNQSTQGVSRAESSALIVRSSSAPTSTARDLGNGPSQMGNHSVAPLSLGAGPTNGERPTAVVLGVAVYDRRAEMEEALIEQDDTSSDEDEDSDEAGDDDTLVMWLKETGDGSY